MNKKLIIGAVIILIAVILAVMFFQSFTNQAANDATAKADSFELEIIGVIPQNAFIYINSGTTNGTRTEALAELSAYNWNSVSEATFLGDIREGATVVRVDNTFYAMDARTNTGFVNDSCTPSGTPFPLPTASFSPTPFSGNAEQAEITTPAYDSPTAVYVTVQNTGSGTVTISSASIDGNAATVSGVPNNAVPSGTIQTFTISFAISGLTFVNTAQYTINLETAKGNTLTATYIYGGQPSDQTSAEQVSITNVVLSNTGTVGTGQAIVTVQNTGSATVDISTTTIDGNAATITAATSQTTGWASGNQVAIAKGSSVQITMTVSETFVNSAQYTIALTTAEGNTIVNTATYTGP